MKVRLDLEEVTVCTENQLARLQNFGRNHSESVSERGHQKLSESVTISSNLHCVLEKVNK